MFSMSANSASATLASSLAMPVRGHIGFRVCCFCFTSMYVRQVSLSESLDPDPLRLDDERTEYRILKKERAAQLDSQLALSSTALAISHVRVFGTVKVLVQRASKSRLHRGRWLLARDVLQRGEQLDNLEALWDRTDLQTLRSHFGQTDRAALCEALRKWSEQVAVAPQDIGSVVPGRKIYANSDLLCRYQPEFAFALVDLEQYRSAKPHGKRMEKKKEEQMSVSILLFFCSRSKSRAAARGQGENGLARHTQRFEVREWHTRGQQEGGRRQGCQRGSRERGQLHPFPHSMKKRAPCFFFCVVCFSFASTQDDPYICFWFWPVHNGFLARRGVPRRRRDLVAPDQVQGGRPRPRRGRQHGLDGGRAAEPPGLRAGVARQRRRRQSGQRRGRNTALVDGLSRPWRCG